MSAVWSDRKEQRQVSVGAYRCCSPPPSDASLIRRAGRVCIPAHTAWWTGKRPLLCRSSHRGRVAADRHSWWIARPTPLLAQFYDLCL